jgi:polysaccharide biosynthesis protein PslH
MKHKRILVITQMYPSGSTGTSVKTLRTLILLAKAGFTIDVVCPHYSKMIKVNMQTPRVRVYPFEKQTISKLSLSYLTRVWRIVLSWKPFRVAKLYDKKIEAKINQLYRKHDYNYIFFDGFSTVQYARSYDLRHVYIDDEDIVTLLWKRCLTTRNPLLKGFFFTEWIKCLWYERIFFPRMSRIWAISPNSLKRLRQITSAQSRLMPTIVQKQEHVFQPRAKHIVFSGLLSWQENVTGIVWFLQNCWPGIHKTFPTTKLYITGQLPDNAVISAAKNAPNVVLTGFVKDLKDIYKTSALAIAPIFINAGIKVKILTYLSYGLPVVANKEATWGMHSVAGVDLATKHTFTKRVLALLNNKTRRKMLSTQGHLNSKKHHSDEALQAFFAKEGIVL